MAEHAASAGPHRAAPKESLGLLTFPTYGTWLPGPARGRVERLAAAPDQLIEPDDARTARGRRSLKWPVILLDERQRRLLLADLHRIARLRRFRLLAVTAAADHVHVLLACDADRDLLRLTQLVKGALARMLTVAAGDAPARTAVGIPAVHHKWWARQYVLQVIDDDATLHRVRSILRAHRGPVTTADMGAGEVCPRGSG